MNQCDGCRRNLLIVSGIHIGNTPWDMIACTKSRYTECGYDHCMHYNQGKGCSDPEVNIDCEKLCDWYRTKEEWEKVRHLQVWPKLYSWVVACPLVVPVAPAIGSTP